MTTSVIYARVSSTGERQSTARQVADLTDYANRNGLEVVEVYEEHISGAKRNAERAVLAESINYAVTNGIEVVLFSELSRCGRAVWEVLDTIRTLKDNGINAYFQKEGLSLFGTDGKENPYLALMVSAWFFLFFMQILIYLLCHNKKYNRYNMKTKGNIIAIIIGGIAVLVVLICLISIIGEGLLWLLIFGAFLTEALFKK